MAQTIGDLRVKLGLDDSGFTSGLDKTKKALSVAGGVAVAAGAAIGGAIIKAGDDSKQGLNQIIASTDYTIDDMELLKGVMDGVVASNYGEGFEDVADTISLISQQIDDLSPEQLESVTENAIIMRDVFDQDVNESIRGANALMLQFGLDGEEAFNLMAQGAQNGLNQNKDLADQLSEYAPLWADLGFSAEEMFNSLVNGADNGAYQIDFLNDAMKEFGIRSKDDSKLTREAFTQLGLDADAMGAAFAAGGEQSRAAFDTVTQALFDLEDPLLQNQIGVDLFGVKFEDLGATAIESLTNTQGEISNTVDALEEINDVKYDSIGDNINKLKNQFSVLLSGGDIDPDLLTETITDIFNQSAELITTVLPTVGDAIIQVIPNIVGQIGTLLSTALPDLVQTVVDIVPEILTLLQEQAPMLMQAGMDILITLMNGLAENSELITETIIVLTEQLLEIIVDNLDVILTAGLEITMGLIKGILNALPDLLTGILSMLPEIISTLMEFIPDLVFAGIEIFTSLIKELPYIISQIVLALPEIWLALKEGFGDWLSNMPQIGIDLMLGLIEGIKSQISAISDTIREITGNIVGDIKEFFGIASPSKVMMELGAYTGEGFAMGISGSMPDIQNAYAAMVNPATTNYSNQSSVLNNNTYNMTYQAATSDNDQVNMADLENRIRRAYA